MTDTILYYNTKISKEEYVFANKYNIHDRIKYAENNEQFIKWNKDAKFSIELLLEANKKMVNYENF